MKPPIPASRVAEWQAVVPPATFEQRLHRLNWSVIVIAAFSGAILIPAIRLIVSAFSFSNELLSSAHSGTLYPAPSGITFFPFFFVAVALVVVGIAAAARLRIAGKEIGDMMDLPPAVPQYPVRVVLWAGEVPYGSDTGIVAFIDHRLIFHGILTTFDISRADVVESFGANQRTGPLLHELVLSDETKPRKVTFSAFDRLPSTSISYQTAFVRALREWRSEKGGRQGTSLLPPRFSLPKTVRSAKRACLACACIPLGTMLTAAAVFWLAFHSGPHRSPLNGLFFAGIFLETFTGTTVAICVQPMLRYLKLRALNKEAGSA